jgi:ADP-heptose:LPS heptosyltransferase
MSKICIIRESGGIGDILMMSPIIKELALLNKSKIDIYLGVDLYAEKEVLRNIPFVNQVKWVLDLDKKLYEKIYDLSYVAYAYEQAGYNFSRQEIFAKYCKVMPKSFLPIYNNKISYSFKNIYVAIHTEAAEKRRSWKQEYTLELISWLLLETDSNILYLNQTPLEIKNKRILDCSNHSIEKCVQLLTGASLLIAVDSCFMHFAASLKIKTLVLFGSTKPETRIKHYPTHKSLYTPNRCKGCYYKDCSNYSCMDEIKPKMLIEELKKNAFLF